TKQIVVYRLIGVEESVTEDEYTQKRESLKVGKIGTVNKNRTENGYVSAQNSPKTELFAAWKITKDTQIFHQRHPKTDHGTQRNPKI
ncbi:TPA: primosomal protein, partial [Escherichia coli]